MPESSGYYFRLTTAYASVRLDQANRAYSNTRFSYPGYLLDSESLQTVLQPHLTLPCQPSELYRLAPILCGPDPLGAKLRSLIVTSVQDGVYSSVVSTASYQAHACSVLNRLGAKIR